VASQDDPESMQAAQYLTNRNKNAKLMMFEDAGHGTNMFRKNELAPTILKWLNENV
jgi:hypothetical protein